MSYEANWVDFAQCLSSDGGAGGGLAVRAEDPYIEFTGTQCVDTGYHASGQTAVVADFQMTDTTTAQQLVWSAGTKLCSNHNDGNQ